MSFQNKFVTLRQNHMKMDSMNKENHSIYEGDASLMASEPLLASSMPNSPQAVGNRHIIPAGMPQSVDEALADIEEGEKEFERNETVSHRDVMQMIWNKIERYVG